MRVPALAAASLLLALVASPAATLAKPIAPEPGLFGVSSQTGMVSVPGADKSAAALPALMSLRAHMQGRRMQEGADEDACLDACKVLPKQAVCGADGKTYETFCYPLCKKVDVAYFGKCTAKPCLCPAIWAPVCGGGRSFVNSCFATCAGVNANSTKSGFCASDCNCPDTKAPVCGQDGKTYTNVCTASCAGTSVAYSGACDERLGKCACAPENSPVCATTTRSIRLPTGDLYNTSMRTTFASACLAECEAGATKEQVKKGACEDMVQWDASALWCGCKLTLEPVCGTMPLLNTSSTQLNKCVANCIGFNVINSTTATDGICKDECIAPADADPVCSNDKKTYRTAVNARCKGATSWTKGACTPCNKCPFPTMDSFVCGEDGLPYGNQCLAECTGVAVAHAGFCQPIGGDGGDTKRRAA